ncbi:N,N'-diacetylchitobiose phosphorylase [Anaerocolumna cellulosilytica]|uniref:N,N'-diacetylchitobiose phosphorylase n=1 Tax=Anaerocolumna cellulosilytica TaxID=433286 RepID=A0A6S6R4E8_9FIRM|nr:N,N'-diacetylchitobiose phosphorylase [Anaerocolumna cellulosilytica]MBB5194947.1 cellobiose phosphorylase [Anaerocolumna cellulosilytica]BCJ96219.1 N,N'-diacetylchitobiose phosphorylase [Anaerocolumna cellulosilytica]
MNYGYFDETNKEYVITRPDTPAPWANYLGSPEYGAIISNNAGGYSFVKSGANGRITRYIFNSEDKPGRYIYLRDNDNGDYWSASWQPVGKDLAVYKNECHHGTAYTNIKAEYKDIETEALYYVPLNKTYEVWRLKVTNSSDKVRNISTFGFIEFTNENNYENDQVNLQYTLFITRTYFKENKILQTINENTGKNADGTNFRERFFGCVGAPVVSYNGDKDSFLGRYRSYGNPKAVEEGKCDNVLNYNSNGCGALHSVLELQPGETKEIVYVLGQYNDEQSSEILDSYSDLSIVEKELAQLKGYWHGKLGNLQINTPSKEFNSMINTWNAYQCFITFIWSRAASFIYCGLRNGYGYRDTVQDIQGIIHLDPDMAAEKIRFMLSAQVDNGGGLPLVKFNHNAGKEDTPDDMSYVQATGHPAYRADDALWLFPTILKYIAETGNKAFLDEVVLYANGGEGSVYDHLQRAIRFSMERMGDHNMPAGLHADWNDCLRLGKKGESTFVALQLYYAMTILRGFAEVKGDAEYIGYLNKVQEELGNTIQTICWEGDRYIRGIKEDGQVIGSKKDPEANMWLNPQSWAVISGLATKEQAETALESVHRELNTPYGVRVMAPSYVDHAFDGALAILFNPSTKENGGIFSQPQGWIILAEALMGHGNRAFEYFMESSPAAQNDNADTRILEPYVHGQFTEATESPFEGRSHVHWLTGTASTVMVGCVEGILGMRPDADGLLVAPSIPSDWKEMTINKKFRGKDLQILVKNPDGAQSGCKEFYINGEKLDRNYIPANKLKDNNEVVLIM